MVASAQVPLYPPVARLANVEGVVHLKVTTDGHHVVSTQVEDGHRLLAALAEENVRTWQFSLHEPTTFTARRPRLQNFGCTFSYNEIVIFVEPHSHKHLTTNTARTSLLFKGEPLPWDDWANEFRAKLPQEIRDLEETISAMAAAFQTKPS